MESFKILSTNHTSFTVSDLEWSLSFFRDILGFEVTSKGPEYAREYAERVVGLSRGAVVFDGPSGKLTDDILQQIYYRDSEAGDDDDV